MGGGRILRWVLGLEHICVGIEFVHRGRVRRCSLIANLGLAVHLMGKYEVMLRTVGLLGDVVDMNGKRMLEELGKIRLCRELLNAEIMRLTKEN